MAFELPALAATLAAVFGLVFLLVVVWVAVVLGSSPAGELAPELVYLTARDLRGPAFLVLAVLGLEAVQLVVPLLAQWGLLAPIPEVDRVLDLAQGGVLVVAALKVLLVTLRYTHGGLERRIHGSIETLAFLQGQRRKKRRG